MNLPTWLTTFRLFLIPFVVILLFIPFAWSNIAAAALFIIASLTDWLDGWLARTLKKTSGFGAFLDPVADKLLVCVILIMLVYRVPYWYMGLITAVIIGREITISALREWMASRGKRNLVAVDKTGKYKTAVQMAAIIIILLTLHTKGLPFVLGTVLLAIAAGLALWSMVGYIQAAWPQLQFEQQAQADQEISKSS